MRRIELGFLFLVLIAVSAQVACSEPAGVDRYDAERPVWVIVERDRVAGILDVAGDPAQLVESAADRAIVKLREADIAPLADLFHRSYRRCGGFTAHSSLEAAHAALFAEPAPAALAGPDSLEPRFPEVVTPLIAEVDAARILATIAGLSAFPSRYYQSQSGVDAAHWLRDRWLELAAHRTDASVELYAHDGWAQPSVMLTVPGETLADEVIVVGGHLDSISFFGDTAPGADDDASGVATLSEVARILLEQDVRLERTVIFVAYAAEEVGLRGSGEIAADFAAQGIPVAGVMQLDMTNYNGSASDIVLITDNTDPAQTAFLSTLADTYLPALSSGTDACGYACSDHASWHRKGFATVLPFEATLADSNPTIHTPDDTLEVSDNSADHAAKFAKLALAYVVELGEVAADGEEPSPAIARIAQVAYDVPGIDADGESVDLQNAGGEALDLTGWTLTDGESTWAFSPGTSIEAGGFLSIARDADGFAALYGVLPDVAGLSLALANGGDELSLRDPSGALVDHVAWERADWPLAADTGESIVRTAAEDTDTAADFSIDTTPAPLGGTATQP